MGLRNPGKGGAPGAAIATGKTAYVSPAFTQNSNGYFTNCPAAMTWLNMAAGETAELVIYPGTYADKLNLPALNNITLLIRGFPGYSDLTILAGGMGGDFSGGGNNASFRVFNISCVHSDGHGADFYLGNSGNVVNYWFENCNFETGNAASYGFYFNAWNLAPANHRGTFVNCRFQNSTLANWAFNDTGQHTSETTWAGCIFAARSHTGAQVANRTYLFDDCKFLDFLEITQALGTNMGRAVWNNCQFQTYISLDSDTNKPDIYFRHCRMYGVIDGPQADAVWHFDCCVWSGITGAEITAVATKGVAGASWHLMNCVLDNAKIQLTNGDAATVVSLANCTVRNDPFGAFWADLAAGAAGITAYNLVSDVTTAAGIVVTGAGNQYPVAI